MNTSTDVAIVGGGIIGLLTARELAGAGCRVTVVDRARVGDAASRAAGGILSPLVPWQTPEPVWALAAWSQPVFPTLCEHLERRTGMDPGWRSRGMLLLDPEDPDDALAWARAHGVAAEWLKPERVAIMEPALSRPDRGAVHLPGVATLDCGGFLDALREELIGDGVEILEGMEVTGLLRDGRRVVGVRAGDRAIRAEHVVVSAGAWSRHLTERAGAPLRIRPVRGQIVQFALDEGTVNRLVLTGRRYLVPGHGGGLLAGSTLEETGFDDGVTREAGDELRKMAVRLVPQLENVPVEDHWAGLRPGTPDDLPCIGPPGGVPGLWLNTGHFTHGILLAPASARLLADRLLERPPIVDPAPFSPDRAVS